MSARCFFVISVFNILLLFSAVPVSAQSGQGQWLDDLYLVDFYRDGVFPRISSVLVDEKNYIHKTIPGLTEATDFQIPRRYRTNSGGAIWHNDALYEIAYGDNEKDEKGGSMSEFRRWTLAKWKDDKWHYIGEYKTGADHWLRAIPCDDDKFIIISSHTDLTGNNGPDRTPFVRMSIPLPGKKELRILSSIGHGQEEYKEYMSGKYFFMAALSDIVIADRHAVLINYGTGLYWIFSLEKTALLKAGNIFKKVTPEMLLAKGSFLYAILCVAPEKEGTVLIAAQEEDYFLTETAYVDEEIREILANNPLISLEEINQIQERRNKEVADRNPFIVWYRIYPESGKIERLAAPPEGGSHLREGGKNDKWRPMPDGSVKMGAPQYSEKTPEKTKQGGVPDALGAQG
jgi:hypothetical protein